MTGNSMSQPDALERRLRLLLKVYPKTFREGHEQEMLSVLMAEAGEDRRRPSFLDVVNVATNGLLMRTRRQKFYSAWALSHSHAVITIRVISGVWLVILSGILCAIGYRWGLVLLLPAGLHFYLAHHLARAARS
ncbi:MAG: hypothetical protein ACYC0H_14060 [Solirubrobacteraceae bacterium]